MRDLDGLPGLWDAGEDWSNDDYFRGWRSDLVTPKEALRR